MYNRVRLSWQDLKEEKKWKKEEEEKRIALLWYQRIKYKIYYM